MAVRKAVCTVEVPPRAQAVPDVRRHARAVLARWRTGDRLAGLVELVVSELVTNAVVHAGAKAEPEGGRLCLTLRWDDGGVAVVVRDSGARFLPVASRAAGLTEHGRGLLLVAALAKEWGAEPLPRGKRVWCLLARR
jgi:serine/threonine-protein kinase RsbW